MENFIENEELLGVDSRGPGQGRARDPELVAGSIKWAFYYSKARVDEHQLATKLKEMLKTSTDVEVSVRKDVAEIKGTPHNTMKRTWYLFVYGGDVLALSDASVINGDTSSAWDELGLYPFKVPFSSELMASAADALVPHCRPAVQVSFCASVQTKYLDRFDVEADARALLTQDAQCPVSRALLGALADQVGVTSALGISSVRLASDVYICSGYTRFLGTCSRRGTAAIAPAVRSAVCRGASAA
ncbi:ADL335Wp [Eremothecium gossypii ATCC 10895]|uniref:ADL335Wp n=1 Tax=Eremothecium gossypii (strain ATCC 10895 / CBS 109.51 / FGSC 9923 / NRRL Y-1056) TaxID=284811 RepID=Q75BA1_EREGS|nr:ADL335Wp [Eremothecium gossypii ATCC 10895]AAS51585.1 ADL335Wp [Eremothecium gossypii ATCC 10895]